MLIEINLYVGSGKLDKKKSNLQISQSFDVVSIVPQTISTTRCALSWSVSFSGRYLKESPGSTILSRAINGIETCTCISVVD